MHYVEYDAKVVGKYGWMLVGLPSTAYSGDGNVRDPSNAGGLHGLQLILDSIDRGAAKWVQLTDEELEARTNRRGTGSTTNQKRASFEDDDAISSSGRCPEPKRKRTSVNGQPTRFSSPAVPRPDATASGIPALSSSRAPHALAGHAQFSGYHSGAPSAIPTDLSRQEQHTAFASNPRADLFPSSFGSQYDTHGEGSARIGAPAEPGVLASASWDPPQTNSAR